ncbi:hypothetical protein NDU88_005675 [Pleurodeles waltl]|uniref:Uncharacterized protein n=1 Tax=Pleurodeles waltl TaxID=8319 RepID=A0AAV7MDK3_PLEWA|nr:hypothetical protein NDU88_005675 [Pleurodeles waltl]
MPQGAARTEEPNMGDLSTQLNLEIKNIILEGNRAITEKIDGGAIIVALLHKDMDKIRGRMKELGTRADDMDKNVYISVLLKDDLKIIVA